MTTPLLEGFPPVVDDDARLLILGSFPSVQSLATRQYYGNPRNAFWPITSELFGFDAAAPYETRLAALQSRRRGAVGCAAQVPPRRQLGCQVRHEKFGGQRLWSAVRRRTGRSTRVCFNGRAAEQLFARTGRTSTRRSSYRLLPSTSPARAMPAGQKLAGLAGDRAVMTPAVAGAPTVGPPRSAR